MFLQQLVTGISVGGIYALLATGYSLIYSLLDFSNWAHGEFAMVSAYIAIVLSSFMGMPFVLAAVGGHGRRRAGEFSLRTLRISPHPPQRRSQYVPDDRRHGTFQRVSAGGQPDFLRSVPVLPLQAAGFHDQGGIRLHRCFGSGESGYTAVIITILVYLIQ